MTDLDELQKQLADIREGLKTLLPGSSVHQKLREEQAALEAQLTGSGAVAQGDGAMSVGEDGIGIGGNLDGTLIKGEQNQVFRNSTVILAGDGARILVGEHARENNNKPDAQAITSYAPTSTNILTFLFTDIEGSTQLWEQRPEAMKAALARHDAILRGAIESHKGKVFKTVGDAFYAAFPNARNALKAALAAQRALQAEAWGETVIKVRMALHTGSVEVRDNDYFGPPLNRVARLMSAGHGGQVLLSTAFAEFVRPNLPEGVELRDMGERSLKDLIRPEHIYQLMASGLQTDFPPLKTLEVFGNNLPVQLTSFIGREKEIAAVKSLMAEHRLITLTGSGGTGKTRLSLQIAATLPDSFSGGIWFVELAPLSDPALIPQTVLTVLGLREESGRPAIEMLTQYLQSKKILLILDNCEHLIEAAAQFAETLLQTCTTLQILVSSREALGIAGEKSYPVRSLSIPKVGAPQTVETVTQFEAVRLFLDRAQAVSAGFTVSAANAAAVAQICTRLDGIPLAIELAAARVKMLKPEQIAERLDDRFRLLTGGNRTALPRQQTLRAMIDWSYDLLPEAERALLRRLSVFAGGWTLEAAETVGQGPGIDDYNVFDPLAQLVNKSLVVVVDADDNTETRYRLLETVRQYAREKLSETGEGMSVRDAHLQYFLSLAERAELELIGPRTPEWVKRLEEELDNIRAALTWSLKQDVQVGLCLTSVLMRYWSDYTDPREDIYWLSQLLRQPAASMSNATRARALTALGYLHNSQFACLTAEPFAREGLALYRALGDQRGIAFALLVLGVALCSQDDFATGRPLVFESLTLYRTLGDRLGIAQVLHQLGALVDNRDSKRTRAYLEESLGLFRELGYVAGITRTLTALGQMALWSGDFAIARIWLTEALEIYRSLGRSDMPSVMQSLGELSLREGDYEQARIYLEKSLSVARESGEINSSYWLLAHLGYIALRQGDQAHARALFINAQQGLKEAGFKIGVAYVLEGLASLAVLQGQHEQAVRLFAWADATRETVDDLRPPVEQVSVDRDLATIRSQLDEAAFAEAQAAGRAMSMDEAIALALESTHD